MAIFFFFNGEIEVVCLGKADFEGTILPVWILAAYIEISLCLISHFSFYFYADVIFAW